MHDTTSVRMGPGSIYLRRASRVISSVNEASEWRTHCHTLGVGDKDDDDNDNEVVKKLKWVPLETKSNMV